ncbi:MAG: hypothetical protein ACTHLZ_18230 [Tepidisphaeraceae bacterium]
MPTKQVAAKYSVSPAWVRRLKQQRRNAATSFPAPAAVHAGSRSIGAGWRSWSSSGRMPRWWDCVTA